MLVVLHGQSIFGWAYADWAAASAETRQSLTFAGPFVAGCSAWTASRFTSLTSLVCPPGAGRRGVPLVVAQLWPMAACSLAGWLLGILPLDTFTALTASWGGPDVLVLAGSAAALLAFVSLGYLVGCVLSFPLAAPAAVVLSLACVLAYGTNGLAAAPVWPFEVVAGYVETQTVGIFRVVFFLGCTVLFGCAAAWWIRTRRLDRTSLAPATTGLLATLVPVAVLAVIASSSSPDLIRRDTSTDPICAAARKVQVCVHPARTQLLPQLQASTQRMQDTLNGVGLPYSRVVDATLWPTDRPGLAVLQLQDHDADRWQQAAVQDLAAKAAGLSSCRRVATSVDPGTPAEPVVVAEALTIWLTRQTGHPEQSFTPRSVELADTLSTQPATAVTDRLRASLAQIRACQGSREDLL